jgi:GntR family transcriptional regulator
MSMKWDDPLAAGNPAPLWFQIAERLRAAIADGRFRPGEPLPSEAMINAAFGVSRATSRSALDRLEQDGLITRRSGRGSIVVVPRVDQPATVMAGFADDMRRRGLEPSYTTRFAGKVRAPAEVSHAFGVKPGTSVFQSQRLLKADRQTIGYAVSWLAPPLFRSVKPPSATDLETGSLYGWLARQCAVQISSAVEFIEAAIVEPEMAVELEVPDASAVLIARRLSKDQIGRPVEYAVLHFRPDRYRFRIEMQI